MANLIDYVENEMRSFKEKSFSQLDSLVLSQFSYIHLDGIVPGFMELSTSIAIKELFKAEHFEKMLLNVRDAPSNKRLLTAMAASPRFRDIKMDYYVNKIDSVQEKQFSAVTYFLNDKTAYVAFRGTDSTIVGWKEDFNMSFSDIVPSQQEAVKYLNDVGIRFFGKILMGGHSKGGNLAVYAAMKCNRSIEKRITTIYSHDGPGFQETIVQSENFSKIKRKIKRTLPQSSLIGMLLENQDTYTVVKSNEFWFMQHDPFSWLVENDDFIYQERITGTAKYTNKTINQWLSTLTNEERERFIDTLYAVISKTNEKTVNQFSENVIKDGMVMLNAYKGIDDETKKFVFQTIRELGALSIKNLIQHREKSKPESSI